MRSITMIVRMPKPSMRDALTTCLVHVFGSSLGAPSPSCSNTAHRDGAATDDTSATPGTDGDAATVEGCGAASGAVPAAIIGCGIAAGISGCCTNAGGGDTIVGASRANTGSWT